MVQIALGLGLSGEVLLPVPFLQEFLRKEVAIGPALRIEAGAGIAVPVPGAANGGAGLEHPHPHPEFAQPVELVEASSPRRSLSRLPRDAPARLHGRSRSPKRRCVPTPRIGVGCYAPRPRQLSLNR